MSKARKLAACLFLLIASTVFSQTQGPQSTFSISLRRDGCLANCPDYEVTLRSDGSVQYHGHANVRVLGTRHRRIPVERVLKLADKLSAENFMQWNETENDTICLDDPEVTITVTSGGVSHHVVELCGAPGRIRDLAAEIDDLSGVLVWVRKVGAR